jgi:hypothetical protein
MDGGVVFVKPETVVRWHRAGFRRYWTWLPRRGQSGRPTIDAHLRTLIARMATENPTWGAPRIHGELCMLGIDVSERSEAIAAMDSRQLPHVSSTPGSRSIAPNDASCTSTLPTSRRDREIVRHRTRQDGVS